MTARRRDLKNERARDDLPVTEIEARLACYESRLQPTRIMVALLDEVTRTGEPVETCARRLGISPDSVTRWLEYPTYRLAIASAVARHGGARAE